LRKTLAQQSCLQLKGPVRRYRPDAEAPDAPLRIAVLSIGQRHSLRVGPGCRLPQRKFRTSRMPSRADVRANFSSPSLCFTRMKPSRRSIPGLVERGQGRGFEYLHYPDAEPHITLGVTLPSPITTPVNGLGALISLIFGVNGPSRGGCALAFVNASEAGVPDQPMASLLSVKGVSPNCPEARMRAVLTARAGRRARSVGCRGPCVFERLMYLAAFFLIGNVRDLSGDRNWSAKIADESGIP